MVSALADILAPYWPPGMAPARYAAMGVMVLAGACLQGAGGLGFAMLCAPVAALLFPELVPGPLLALACPLAVMAMVREYTEIDWTAAAWSLAGRAAGTLVAAGCLAVLPANTLSVLFALLILAAVALSLRGWTVTPTRTSNTLAGIASGVMGTITSAGAPPLAIAMQSMPAARLRATLGCVFFLGSAISLAALGAVGRMHTDGFVLALLLTPWMVVGFAASGLLARRLSHRGLRHFLLGLASLGAIAVLAQTWARA
jgi:uncharacterized membrane protein YfcA